MSSLRSAALRAAALVSVLACSPSIAAGADGAYPSQPIRMVVAATPGTSMDIVARIIEPVLSQRLGQPVIVDNRAGASGTIGTEYVARAAPDGYTLLVGAQSMVVVPLLVRAARYDPINDFEPISLVDRGRLLLATNPNSGFDTVAGLIAAAKAHPGRLAYSSPGVGLPQHLAMARLLDVTGIDMQHVPYKGSAGAMVDLMSNQVAASLLPVQMAMSAMKAGKLKPLAVASSDRDPHLPDVPTLSEAGVDGVDEAATLSNFVMAPKGTPAPIVARLNKELHVIMNLPQVREKLEANGFEVATSTPEELRAMLVKVTATFGEIIRKNQITVE